jgi:hypothetical protein
MTPIQQPAWWADRVAIPVLFTFFGAALGFGFGRLKDWLDDRKTQKAFLKAVRIEMESIRGRLQGTLNEATEYREKLAAGQHEVFHPVTSFQTAVYTSQLGKLKNLCDLRVFEVVQFYDKLSNLERIKSYLASASFDLRKLTDQDAGREGPLIALYSSALNEAIRRINDLLPIADHLILKLPQ